MNDLRDGVIRTVPLLEGMQLMGLRDRIDQLSDDVVSAAKAAGDAYKAGIQAQASAKILEKVLDRLVDPKVLLPAIQLAMLAGRGYLQSQLYDTQAAIDPAHHVLSALSDIERVSSTVRDWAARPIRMRITDWFRPNLFWSRKGLEVTEQIQRLANVLWAGAGECDLAGGQILQKFNPLCSIIPLTPQPSAPPAIQRTNCPIPIPSGCYRTAKAQTLDVQVRVGILADYLVSMAQRCIQNIEAASLNRGQAYSANIVRAEGSLVIQRTVEAIVACSALAHLASQPVCIGELLDKPESEQLLGKEESACAAISPERSA